MRIPVGSKGLWILKEALLPIHLPSDVLEVTHGSTACQLLCLVCAPVVVMAASLQ